MEAKNFDNSHLRLKHIVHISRVLFLFPSLFLSHLPVNSNHLVLSGTLLPFLIPEYPPGYIWVSSTYIAA